MGSDPGYYREQTQRLPLDEAEKAWLAGHPVLRVGIDASWAPIEFADARGVAQGIAPATVREMEKRLGIRIETVILPSWSEALAQLADGRVDLLPSLDVSRKDRGDLRLTEPYVSFPAVIFSDAEVAYLGNLDAVKDELVAVVEGDIVADWIRQVSPVYPPILFSHQECDIVADWIRQVSPTQRLLPVANTREALRRVAAGEAFAFVGNPVTTSYYIVQTGLTQIRVAGETPFTYHLAMGVRGDQPMLASVLQKGLDGIPASEREAITQAWQSIRYSHDVDFGLLWRVLAGGGLAAIVILAWNRRLAREIGPRHAAEAALREAKEAAEQSNRAKTEFLANISHELRTPLNLLLGFANLLQDTERDERGRHWLQSLRSAGRTLATLIDDLLDLSRIESGHLCLRPVATNLRSELRELADWYAQAVAEKGLRLAVTVHEALPEHLWLDADRLRQILGNLLGNAVKFTHAGQIEVRAAPVSDDSDTPRFSVIVTDSGPGIDLREQARIFEPFTQGDAITTAGGAGLGLAIGRRLARLMGGDLRVQSAPGQGSAFTLDLPLQTPPMQARVPDGAASRPAGARPHWAPARVLTADDRADNRELLRDYLREQPLDLIEAADGAEALARARELRPQVILMDIAMPGMDGVTAARRLRAEAGTAAIPLVAITATTTLDADPSLRNAFDAVLRKPVGRDELLDCLARWLAPAMDAPVPIAAPPQPPSITLSTALRQRLHALQLPYISINELQAFTTALQDEADVSTDAALRAFAVTLEDAAQRCDVPALLRQVEALRHAAVPAPVATIPAHEPPP